MRTRPVLSVGRASHARVIRPAGSHASRHSQARTGALILGCALLPVGLAGLALQVLPSWQLLNRSTVMAAAFIPYGLPTLLGSAALLAASGRRWARALAVAALAGIALQVWSGRAVTPSVPPSAGGETVRLLTMNMRCDTRGLDDLNSLLDDVEVAVVQGLNEQQVVALGEAWAPHMPHRTFHPMPHLPECGTSVFSRTPLRVVSDPHDPQPAVEVTTRNGGSLILLPVDFPTPTKGISPWLAAFDHLTSAVHVRSGPIVVAGDFNAVPQHAPMAQLLEDANLRHTAKAACATPTFPAGAWYPPLIALDHVLVTPDMGSSHVSTSTVTGQSHRALVVDFGPHKPGRR